jgi:3-deoxy-D-manno-octulosonic-acid transferase
MIHAVSVGELNATSALVRILAENRPDLRFVISTTTKTGWERSKELYGQDEKVSLIRYPIDFSWAVKRVLDAQRPSAVILMELEVWPNFTSACAAQEIPIILANGRLTAKSYRNYRIAAPLTSGMFSRLSLVCAQEQVYADRFIHAGVPQDRVRVTGTMKFDTAQIATRIAAASEIATSVGLKPGSERIIVCGSTGPEEEKIVLDAYAELLRTNPGLRLVLVPRKPERFDEVAEMIASRGYEITRRSKVRDNPMKSSATEGGSAAVVLGDTMGELRAFYSLADVVFVGRTLVDFGASQHGSDMIEPAALGKPVIVGPYTGNFTEVMNRFREAGAIIEIRSDAQTTPSRVLQEAIAELLASPARRNELGQKAQEVVRANQGATARNVEAILGFLPAAQRTNSSK